MPKINQLSSHVADLIAAGEVVERPSSVVKELLENAIDAGASHVTVEIQNGGMTYIRLTDDGCGMEPADAEIAFLRHATSKISSQEDLAAIGTLGFRGEALAAISAVSRIDLMTCARSAAVGVRLHLEAGKITQKEEAGCPAGTTIIVRDLFFNTPARMKFMKSDSAEGASVFAAVQRQAMAHPEVSIRFLKDGKEQLQTAGDGKRYSAIYAVWGRQLASDLLPVESTWEKTSVSGFVSRPTATRGNRTYQIFFVNGRFVRSKMLSTALETAYQNQIMVGRMPACVLNITLPYHLVDVNVHPAKTEVKFLSEKSVFDCVHYGVLAALNQASGKKQMQLPRQRDAAPAAPSKPAAQPRQEFFRTMSAAEYQTFAAALEKAPAQKPDTRILQAAMENREKSSAAAVASVVKTPKSAPVQPKPKTAAMPELAAPAPAKRPESIKPAPVSAEIPEVPPAQLELPAQSAPWRLVGEILDTYIIVQQDDAMLLIDKHAAHERILFEDLKRQNMPICGQMLLEPISWTPDRETGAALLEQQALLATLGYDLSDLGDGALLIRQVPDSIDCADAAASLEQIAALLLSGRQLQPEQLRDRLLHSIACKAAIKAGSATSAQELEALVRQVLSRDDLKYCPHGRPICIFITRQQLERQFGRA